MNPLFGRNHLRELQASFVVLHTKDDRSFQGVLTGLYRDCAVLSHAKMLLADGRSPEVGEIRVPIENISFYQAKVSPE